MRWVQIPEQRLTELLGWEEVAHRLGSQVRWRAANDPPNEGQKFIARLLGGKMVQAEARYTNDFIQHHKFYALGEDRELENVTDWLAIEPLILSRGEGVANE